VSSISLLPAFWLAGLGQSIHEAIFIFFVVSALNVRSTRLAFFWSNPERVIFLPEFILVRMFSEFIWFDFFSDPVTSSSGAFWTNGFIIWDV
jgi:hypothetical protein